MMGNRQRDGLIDGIFKYKKMFCQHWRKVGTNEKRVSFVVTSNAPIDGVKIQNIFLRKVQ